MTLIKVITKSYYTLFLKFTYVKAILKFLKNTEVAI